MPSSTYKPSNAHPSAHATLTATYGTQRAPTHPHAPSSGISSKRPSLPSSTTTTAYIGDSLLIRREHNFHIIYLDSLNNKYPDLEQDLKHFWTRAARAAHTHQLFHDIYPHITIHTPTLPTQQNNFDCGIFVLGYHRAIQTWMNTHLPSHRTP